MAALEKAGPAMAGAYVDGAIKDFLDKLAGPSPEPGGGSVSALAGALGAGLVSMVASLTVGSDKYAGVQAEISSLLSSSEAVRVALQDLVQEDAEAFQAFAAAMKLPRDTEERKEERNRAMQVALRRATEVPLAISERALRVAELSLTAAVVGNVNAVSDAGVGVLLADAAAQGAALNVRINMGWLSDKEFGRSSWERVQTILAATGRLREEVLKTTYGRLG